MAVEKTCGYCAKSFSVPNRRSETVKFCSLECKTHGRRRIVECGTCGKAFERPAHLAESKYCSRECYHAAPKEYASRGAHYYKICEACSSSFRVTLTRKNTARFCSRECQYNDPAYREQMGEVQSGASHWRWAGGLYTRGSGYVRVRGGSKSGDLQHRVVIENEMLDKEPNHPFIVEIGGKKKLDSKIDVHHIDRNRSNNELANLLAVTKDAHAQIHHRNRRPDPWECWPYSNALGDTTLRNIEDDPMETS